MIIRGQPTSISHVYELMRDLSTISRWEIDAFGYTTWSFLKESHELLEQPGVEIETGFENGKPIVVLGTIPHGQLGKVRVVYLVAAERFFALGAPMVRYARKYVCKVADKYPGCRFDAYTASPHPQVDRWLALLGFEGPIEEGRTRLFRLYGKKRDVAKMK